MPDATPDKLMDRRSAQLFALIIASIFCFLLVRLFMVQMRPAKNIDGRADIQRFRPDSRVGSALPEKAVRAELRDREGRLLAATWFEYDLVVDMVELMRGATDRAARAARLTRLSAETAKALTANGKRTEVRALAKPLVDAANAATPVRWLRLVKGMDPKMQRAVEDAVVGLRGVRFEHRERRAFPYGAVTAQIVGIVGENPKDAMGRVAGRTGVEFQLDRILAGEAGRLPLEKDAAGRELLPRWIEEAEPVPGGTVTLTVDAEIQRICMEVLEKSVGSSKAEKGSAVVLSARTGEVLAACTWPSVDPEKLDAKTASNLNLGAFLDLYEPGSTIKPLFVSWALQKGIVTMDTKIDCGGADGVHQFGPRLVREYHANPNPLTVQEVLIKSSNVGSVRIAYERLGINGQYEAMAAFRMSGQLKVGYPSMPNNRYTPRAAAHALYTPTSFPQGYEMMMSPLIMARYFLVFARGGEFMDPIIVREARKDGRVIAPDYADPARHVRVIDREVALSVRGALERVMEEGTGKSARSSKYSIAAKTGTPKIGKTEVYNPIICTMAPVHERDPEIVVVVIHHHVRNRGPGTYTGGTVSGPPARDIIERTLEYMRIPHEVGRSGGVQRP
ncbi:MAG: penicillin-binding protein 2 [Planctomycetes bacterium]|nr:penicillin-binding protein 2 [Planctomycetota bacterium]